MSKYKNLFLIILLPVVFLATFFAVNHKALADNISDANMNQICVPPYISTSRSGHHQINGWLNIDVKDRAHLTATYTAAGNCATPAGSDSSYFFGNQTFAQIFQNISGKAGVLDLVDNQADSDVSYNEPVGSSGQDDTRIDQFSGNFDNLMQDKTGGHDAVMNMGDIKNAIANAEVTLGLETDDVGYGCGPSYWKNENFVLTDGKTPAWQCVDSTDISGLEGFVIGVDNFSDLDNFNITYYATANGNTLTVTPVYKNEQGDRTFTWCGNQGKFINKNCQGSLVLNASQSDINSLGTGQGQFAIKDGSGNTANVVVAGTGSSVAQVNGGGAVSATPPGGTSSGKSCEANFNFGFEWVVCPFLRMLDAGAGALNGFVENQLTICTGASDTTGQSCANNILTPQVQNAWAIFRDIASALLVLVMLAMVFSQAMGGGLLDAYSLRKMLPRLVAAVILMQLSWVILKFAVDVSNDLGVGIRDLMYAPFGGQSNMSLQGVVNNVLSVHGAKVAGISVANDSFALFGVLAGSVALVANPIGLLTLGFFVFVSLTTAFLVLVLRKLFIIMLIVLAPVALVLWILPNTEKYWKMWSSNFSKLLAMYPLIMGLIAAGRIFAYITSTTGSGSVTSFADLAIVLFAFFAPYLMLPKAFSWGGSMMSAAAGQVQNRLQKPLMDKGKEGFKGMTERYQGRMGKAYDPGAKGVKGWGKKVFYRVGSGHYNPLPGALGGKRSQRLAIQAGDKWSQEQDEQAGAKIKRAGEKVLAEGYDTYVRTDDGKYAKYQRDADGEIMKDADGKDIKIEVGSKDEAETKHLTGVAAMKQMWVDLAEDGDKYEKKMAIRQLTATSSWPEIQSSFTKNGKRVIDTDAWADSITTSPEDYPRVLRSRVDATPHIDNAAKKALKAELENTDMDEFEQRRFVSAFRVDYAITKQLDNEGFATQSDGFWEEAARMANMTGADGELTAQAQQIRQHLKDRFFAIQQIGGTAPAQLLGHLANGGELQKNVESILGQSVQNYMHGDGTPGTPPPAPEPEPEP
ncbi:MAG TPA: hypothetical protein VFP35_02195 [Candidatus Saccharimonadales bacterium]|nr:hypothetical protein [Candidatus Saccharimonadales bacterium]